MPIEETGTAGRLEAGIGSASPLLPFARAVVAHLERSGAYAPDHDVTVEVLDLLRLADVDVADAIRFLLDRPALLASVFQNADLLPSGDGRAARLIELVAAAVGRAWEESGAHG